MRKIQFTAMLLALLVLLWGCGANTETEATENTELMETTAAAAVSPERKLILSVVEAEEPGYRIFYQEDLGDNASADLTYGDLDAVTVSLDGIQMPLEDAIREGRLTIEELFAFARVDARNGFCQETFESDKGLTHFVYLYPECELHLAYDVYELPNGEQEIIEEASLYARPDPNTISSTSHFYVDEESQWGYRLDREDWGLSFEVAGVSATGLTLNYIQQGGQHIGELAADEYCLYTKEHFQTKEAYLDYLGDEEIFCAIQQEGSGQITLDWEAAFGTLEPGDYYVKLYVRDFFDESQVHPLMVDYYEVQPYYMEFTVE